jgi:hypothetical protein
MLGVVCVRQMKATPMPLQGKLVHTHTFKEAFVVFAQCKRPSLPAVDGAGLFVNRPDGSFSTIGLFHSCSRGEREREKKKKKEKKRKFCSLPPGRSLLPARKSKKISPYWTYNPLL